MKWKKFLLVCALAVSSTLLLSGCSLSKPKKAGLQVITHDIPSSVFIDGQYLNKTPLIEKQLVAGTHTIRIEPDDPQYLPYETDVNLNPGVLTVVTWKSATRPEQMGGVVYEMEKISSKNSSEVSFVTIPDGAIITLEGREKDFSPVTITDVEPGQLEYEVTLPSYETQNHSIEVAAGYKMIISIKLAKLDPTLTTSTTPVDTTTATQSADVQAEVTATQTAAATSSATAASLVEILSTNFFQDGKEVLRVRNNPGYNGAEVGMAEVGQKYPYLKEEIDGWYKISFQNTMGWVSNQYAQLVQ